ncbi:MAG TPA: CxxxxCH/CxxCH domain-containing protein [Anaeromyxobacteraceae bacterium]|nr:CxxxxCH/CxxCH domain-containing protein [Anaeromyxobacteraceae bacterium]
MRAGLPVTLLALAVLGVAACDARAPAESGGGGQPTTGSHPAHLGGAIAEPIACQQCHDPAFNVTLRGDLATANGAQGSFNPTSLTCSGVYCHDGGPRLPIGGGTTPAPVWNPPVALACNGCHALPGGAVATPWHPAVASGVQCALCHPGYTNSTVPPGEGKRIHVNGVADLAPANMTSTCAACHGDSTRPVPPGTPAAEADLIRAAPPVDRNGGTSTALPGVGAHVAHVAPGTSAISAPVQCSACHVVPSAADRYSHVGPLANSPATVDFSGLASANGAQPVLVPPAPGGASFTCSNVYCHAGGPGLVLGGGTLTAPSWNPPSAVTCGSCHALPGGNVDTSAWHPAVAPLASCGLCHDGYTRSSVNPVDHVNGLPNVRAPNLQTNCQGCHGDAARVVPPGVDVVVMAAPPVDRYGSSQTTDRGVGAHQAHLLPPPSGISPPIACTECHVVPTNLLHVGPGLATPATLDFGPLATANGAQAGWDGTQATCTNYCHGVTLTGGSNRSPTWTVVNGTQAACGTCHGNPPTSGAHIQHALPNWYDVSCGTCHPAGYDYGVVNPQAVPFHVNGVTNMNTDPAPGAPSFVNWNPNAPGPNGFRGTATGCHGGTRYWTPGSAGGSCG